MMTWRKISYTLLAAGVFFLAAAGIFSNVWAQVGDFPSKTITWVVPTNPGGGYDTFSRAIAPVMAKYLPGQPNIIIKNIPGAGGRRGNSFLFRSRPDGYTLGTIIMPGALVTQMVEPRVGYDLTKMTWLGLYSQDAYAVSVAGNSPFNSLQDLINAGSKVKFGTPGRGTTGHVVTLILDQVLGINGRIIGIKGGSAPAVTALLRGDIHSVLTSITSFIHLKKAGEVRYLATLTAKRDKLTPDVPTMAELGYPDLNESFAILRPLAGPPGMPRSITELLEKAFLKALDDPQLKKWSIEAKKPIVEMGAAETKALIDATTKVLEKYKGLLKK